MKTNEVKMDIGVLIPERGMRQGEVIMYHKVTGNNRSQLAKEMVIRWGVIMAEPDGEDSEGRQQMRLMSVDEVVHRACNMADALFNEFEDRGWLLELPTPTR